MNILKLAAQLTLDGSRFKAGLKEAESASAKFSHELTSGLKSELAGAFGAGALIAFTKNALTSVGALKDLAEQSHMTTDEVQLTTIAAEHMGLTFADVAAAEKQFNVHRREALESNRQLRDTFQKYGVTLEDLQDPQFRFFNFLEKANAAMNKSDARQMVETLNDMADVLGERVGPKLQEFIRQLHEARRYPLVDKETVEELDDAQDAFDDFIRLSKGQIALSSMHPIKHAPVLDALKLIYNLGKNAFADEPPEEPIDGSALPLTRIPKPKLADRIREKDQADLDKAQRDLQRATMMFGLSDQEKKQALLREKLDEIYLADRRFSVDDNDDPVRMAAAARAKIDALGLLSQLGSSPGKLDVASMTKVGALAGGRSAFVNEGDSQLIQEAKQILGVLKDSKDIQTAIRDKKGLTINASR